MTNLETLETKIAELERAIEDKQGEICTAQSNIETFEYECSWDEYDEYLNEVHETVYIGEIKFSPSSVLKELDPIAYRCGKSDYESNYDLDDCEEYTTLKDELESLEDELELLEAELEILA